MSRRGGRRALGAGLVALLLLGCTTAPDTPSPPASGPAAFAGWSEFLLPGKRSTRYVPRWENGREVVRAEADASASMWRRAVRVEPSRLARVGFSWRVDQLIPAADLSVAERSDSPVRLVFAFDGDRSLLSMRNRMLFELAETLSGEPPPYATLMYVWDNRAPPESVLLGHRTDRVRKIVVESGVAASGRWLSYERDLVADYRRAFGEEPGTLVGIGLMTDADNTASRAAGTYGEVRLFGRDGLAM